MTCLNNWNGQYSKIYPAEVHQVASKIGWASGLEIEDQHALMHTRQAHAQHGAHRHAHLKQSSSKETGRSRRKQQVYTRNSGLLTVHSSHHHKQWARRCWCLLQQHPSINLECVAPRCWRRRETPVRKLDTPISQADSAQAAAECVDTLKLTQLRPWPLKAYLSQAACTQMHWLCKGRMFAHKHHCRVHTRLKMCDVRGFIKAIRDSPTCDAARIRGGNPRR